MGSLSSKSARGGNRLGTRCRLTFDEYGQHCLNHSEGGNDGKYQPELVTANDRHNATDQSTNLCDRHKNTEWMVEGNSKANRDEKDT